MVWPDVAVSRAPVEDDWPPSWAGAWGDDRFGVWAELHAGGSVQRMRWIEPGRFTIGSPDAERGDEEERPAHQVSISRGYWLADTPCTQGMWLAVKGGENPSRFSDAPDRRERPVERVSWDDVQDFLEALEGLLAGQGVQAKAMLPSEAQWEYACRAGTRTAYWWGEEFDASKANVDEAHGGTTPVKRFEANPWGLYDMHGNVLEWCADDMRDYGRRAEVDPLGDTGGVAVNRAMRGGSWFRSAAVARSAARSSWPCGLRVVGRGFRLALRSPGPGGRPGERPEGAKRHKA